VLLPAFICHAIGFFLLSLPLGFALSASFFTSILTALCDHGFRSGWVIALIRFFVILGRI
jgi:hypothetical protein